MQNLDFVVPVTITTEHVASIIRENLDYDQIIQLLIFVDQLIADVDFSEKLVALGQCIDDTLFLESSDEKASVRKKQIDRISSLSKKYFEEEYKGLYES